MYYWISDWTSEIMVDNKGEIDLSQLPKRQLHAISITFDRRYFKKIAMAVEVFITSQWAASFYSCAWVDFTMTNVPLTTKSLHYFSMVSQLQTTRHHLLTSHLLTKGFDFSFVCFVCVRVYSIELLLNLPGY